MSGPFDELLERLTHRLRVDPELRMEVTHELRTHLEDAAAEFAGTGMTAAEAQAAAIKAMGEETEIADKLWQANRRRLRVRRAVKWTAGVTLLPAAGAAAVAVGWSSILAWMAMGLLLGGGSDSAIVEHAQTRLLDSLSPQSRLVVDMRMSGDAMVQRSRELSELNPSDPVFAANYAMAASEFIPFTTVSKEDQSVKTDIPLVNKTLDLVKGAGRVEPENAFYPMLECSDLQAASTGEVDQAAEDKPGFDYSPSDGGKAQRWTLDRYVVSDPAEFAQSLADFRRAAGMSVFDSYTIDLVRRRIDLLPAPENLFDWIYRLDTEISTPIFWLNRFTRAIHVAGWVAYDDAVHHRPAEALAIVGEARRLSLLAGEKSGFLVELLVASGAYSETLAEEALVFKQLGDEKEFERARARYEDWGRYVAGLRHAPGRSPAERSHWSVIDRTMIPSVADLSFVNPAPSRQAEYAVGDRLALAVMMIALMAVAALLALDALVTRLFGRQPLVVAFIGLPRLARVVGISTVVPLAVYAIYAYATAVGGRQYGAFFSLERLTVEYSSVAVVCVILACIFTDRALRVRLAEIGAGAVVPPAGRLRKIIGVLLAAVVAGYVIFWWTRVPDAVGNELPTNGFGLILVPVIDLYGLWWLLSVPIGEPARRSRRNAVAVAGVGLGVLLLGSAGIVAKNIRSIGGPAPWLAAAEFVIGSSLLWVCARQWRRRLRQGEDPPSGPLISHSLPLALSLASMACVMAVIAGIPLHFAERADVRRMSTPGGDYDVLNELNISRLHSLQQRMNEMLTETPPAAGRAS